jgi:hypothetical protein
MFRRRILFGLVVCLVSTLLLGVALVQGGAGGGPGGGPGGQMGGPGGPGGQRFDPAQMRQMMEQRLREQLGATEEEWKVLGPRVMKVSELSRQTSGFGRGMFFGGRRGPQGSQPGGRQGPQGAQERELTAVEKITDQLQTTLENTSAQPEEIKKQLTALRAAKEKAKQELATAQQELRKIVTVRQEAQLVLMGMLD